MTLHRITRAAWLIAALLFMAALVHRAATGPGVPFWQQTMGGVA